MINKDFFPALEALEREKRIKKEIFMEALETALVIAYKRHTGTPKAIRIKLVPESNKIKITAYLDVVDVVENKDTQISLEDARLINRKYKIGDIVSEEVSSKEFGRIAAQTAKQVIMQKLREVEGEIAYTELSQKEDELITCMVRRLDGKNVYVEISKLEAQLAPQDQSPRDRFKVGDKIKVYVKKIKPGHKGPQVIISRSNANFVKKLFEMNVPEIENGLIVVKNIVREAGYRTKIAVHSLDADVDPVGACVGNRGMRVNAIVSELDGEKIDIIPWCEDPLEFIARALSPAKVAIVQCNDMEKSARVIVLDEMLSLAIGRDGQNARLAAKLTGWHIDVKPYSSLKSEEQTKESDEAILEVKPIEEINLDELMKEETVEEQDIFDEDFGELE